MESGLKTLSPSPSKELGKPKSPWQMPTDPYQGGTCSLAAVMDEELAKELQSEEDSLGIR